MSENRALRIIFEQERGEARECKEHCNEELHNLYA
jgi:hypothetical protein